MFKLDFAFLSFVAFVAFGATGCGTIQYLTQAARGQLELSNRARPIEKVIQDERTPPRIARLLKDVPGIKGFGEEQGLKPTSNYTHYVQLDRPYVVYVVSACERLKFQAKTWSFPVVGSFNYLGWFSESAAQSHAEELKAEGWDVDVRGAGAFSTLGWFSDPILSSMIPAASGAEDTALGALANVVLHESVHATLYVNGQSYFNESVASFAADLLTPKYLTTRAGEASAELSAYLRSEKQSAERRKLLHEGYVELEAVYSDSGASDAQKLEKKARVLERLRKDLGFKREINNATLIQFKTYDVGRKDFDALYERCGRDWARFWKFVQTLGPGSFPAEQMEDFSGVLGALRC